MNKKKKNRSLKYFGIGALVLVVGVVAYRLFSKNENSNVSSNSNSNSNSYNEKYANGQSYAEWQSNKAKNFATLTVNECAFPAKYTADDITNIQLEDLFDNIIIPFDNGKHYDSATKKYKKFGYRTKNYTTTISEGNPVTGVYSIIYVPTGELLTNINADFYTKLLNRAKRIHAGGYSSEKDALLKALGEDVYYVSRVEV